ncbi:uncharacterized protein PAC_03603 [Phialocephala subalpina]|uniref:Uncharacterized protein n=1 Tax=Phialocephala subalpina TaxID=576137 RepID=A0A1L7WLS5_9HELO|nr:uncharacterized protein PAC_03603 [Phialocephala subalpina]
MQPAIPEHGQNDVLPALPEPPILPYSQEGEEREDEAEVAEGTEEDPANNTPSFTSLSNEDNDYAFGDASVRTTSTSLRSSVYRSSKRMDGRIIAIRDGTTEFPSANVIGTDLSPIQPVF